MEKHYKLEKGTIVEVLNDIEAFLLTLETIKKDKPELKYEYNIEINELKDPKRWEVKLDLKKDEQEN